MPRLGNLVDPATARALRPIAVWIVAAACFVTHAWYVIGRKSVTFDETIYTVLAQGTLATGQLDDRFTQLGVAPLPVVLTHVPANLDRPAVRPAYMRGVIDDPRHVRRARWWNVVLFALPLLAVVAIWMCRRRGWWAALVATVLVASSPSIIAHGSLATTDMALTTALAGLTMTFAWALAKPTVARVLVYAAVWGVALATKYTAVIGIIPAVGLACAPVVRREAGLLQAIKTLAMALVVAGCVTWMCHDCSWSDWPAGDADAWTVPAPAAGMLAQAAHQRRGHSAYLMGEVRVRGWWYYFPIAAFCKSTPVELGVLAGAVGLALGQWRRLARPRPATDPSTGDAVDNSPGTRDRGMIACGVVVMCVWLVLLMSHVDIGHRYLLPVYPLSIMMAVDWLARRRARRWLFPLMLVVQLASAAAQAPHQLAYFSPLMGGSRQGHRWLGDSNLDWGQDLPALRNWWLAHDRPTMRLVYFGTADPRGEQLPLDRRDEQPRTARGDYRYLAVSVTLLQRIYPPLVDSHGPPLARETLRALFQEQPIARAGYSIWIFDTSQPRIRAILEGHE